MRTLILQLAQFSPSNYYKNATNVPFSLKTLKNSRILKFFDIYFIIQKPLRKKRSVRVDIQKKKSKQLFEILLS